MFKKLLILWGGVLIWNSSLAQTEVGIGEQPTDDPPMIIQPITNCPPLFLPPVQNNGLGGSTQFHELYIKDFNTRWSNNWHSIFLRESLFYPYFQHGSTGALHGEFYSFNAFPFEHIYPYNAQWGQFNSHGTNNLALKHYDVPTNTFLFQQCAINHWPTKMGQLPNGEGADRLYSGIYEFSSNNPQDTEICESNPIFVYFNAAYNGILYSDATDTKIRGGGSGDYFLDNNLNTIITTPTVDYCMPATENVFGYPLKYFVSQNKNEMDLFWNTERVNVTLMKNRLNYTFGICEPYVGNSTPTDPNEAPPGGGNGTVVDPNNDISYLADTANYVAVTEFKPRLLNGIEVFQIDRNGTSQNPSFSLPTQFISQNQYVIISGDIQYGNQTRKIYKKINCTTLDQINRINLFFHKQPDSYNIRVFLK